MSEQEFIDDIQPKQYVRKYTEEGREKQKIHLENIRKKAMEKKRELKEITLKAKLMKLEPKLELAKQYDEYINQKVQPQIQQHQAPQQEQEEEQVVYVQKPVKEKKKKIIYKEVEDDEEEEEQIVYVKTNKPKQQETLDRTLYKSSTEQLHLRAVEERIKHNLSGWYGALMPREY
jgi:hypothetical protein